MIALVALTTAGISGFDHGQIGISFGEAVPIFLLAQDLPAWAVYAAYAAIIPMILGIGIGFVITFLLSGYSTVKNGMAPTSLANNISLVIPVMVNLFI